MKAGSTSSFRPVPERSYRPAAGSMSSPLSVPSPRSRTISIPLFNQTVVQLSALTDGLIDEENGAVGRLLAETRDDLGRRLDALFDPASKESALSLFEEAFSLAATRQQQQLRSTLNPDDDDSPLGRWQAQMSREIHNGAAAITKQLTDMATTLAVRQAQAEERRAGHCQRRRVRSASRGRAG